MGTPSLHRYLVNIMMVLATMQCMLVNVMIIEITLFQWKLTNIIH